MNLRFRTLAMLIGAPFGISHLGGCVWGELYTSCERFHTCPYSNDTPIDAGPDVTGGADTSSADREPNDALHEEDTMLDAQQDRDDDGFAMADAGLDVADQEADVEPACDPAKSPTEASCTIDELYGVFVSPLASDAGMDGTRALPYRSLAVALQRAKTDGKRVYICDDGTGYTEQVTVGATLDGLQVFGGFECSGWTYSTTRRAKWSAPSSPVLTITKLAMGVLLTDLEIVAPDGASPGASSVAVVVNESVSVALRRVKAVAGKGKDGTNGTDGGGPTNTPASAGAIGHNGTRACAASPNPGGASAVSICGGAIIGAGGKGGDGANPPITPWGGSGDNGSPTATAGKGGTGEPVSGSWDCSFNGTGQGGVSGIDGPAGSGGTGLGSLTASGWIGAEGVDGTAGNPGQGGGGGGGAKSPATCGTVDSGLLDPSGASGGSGGGGGCGGNAGKGGGAGGSSIALVSLASTLTLDACELVASDAGNGGNGGQGQPGGNGGLPGFGGSGLAGSKTACAGGGGGQGGNGGPGGGGAGGHSLGIAYRGTAPTRLDLSLVQVGSKGSGGQAGSGTTKGDDGIAAPSQPFQASDGGS